MAYRSRADKKVHVTHRPMQPSQPSPFAAENARHLFVQIQNSDTTHETIEYCLSIYRIRCGIDTFIQFGERHHRCAEPFGGQLVEFRDYI